MMRLAIAATVAAAFACILACDGAHAQAVQLAPGEQCFQATTPTSGGPSGTGTGMVGLLGTISGGSGGNNGTYGGVPLTGGVGSGATANITVSGGAVTAVAVQNPGVGYAVADALSAVSSTIGGVVGFSVPVSSIAINSSLAGGTVGYYVPNTQTFKQTWQNSGQTVLNQNPVALDANGCAIVYGAGTYRQILQDSLGNVIWDQLTSVAPVNPYWAGLASGTANAITLTDPTFAGIDGQSIEFLAAATNTGATTINPSGFAAINVVKNTTGGPTPLIGGEIVGGTPGNLVTVTYSATYNEFFLADYVSQSGCLPIERFGGNGNGIVDNTTALTSALSAVPAGGCIAFSAGKYLFNSPVTYNFPNSSIASLTLNGVGSNATILYWPNVNGGLTANLFGPGHSVHVSGISFTTGQQNGGYALTLLQGVPEGASAQSTLNDVTFRGDDNEATFYWTTGINELGMSNLQINRCAVYGASSGTAGVGISLQGNANASPYYSTIINISNCAFGWVNIGIDYGTYVQNVTIDQCSFFSGAEAIITPSAAGGALSELSVSNSFFNVTSNAISFTTGIQDVTITGNSFFVATSQSGVGLGSGSQNFSVTGNIFQPASGSMGGDGIQGSITNASVIGNTFLNMNIGVVQTSGNQWSVVGNLFQGNTTGVYLAGSIDVVTGNIFKSNTTGIVVPVTSSIVNIQSNVYNGNTTKYNPNGSTGNVLIGGGSD